MRHDPHTKTPLPTIPMPPTTGSDRLGDAPRMVKRPALGAQDEPPDDLADAVAGDGAELLGHRTARPIEPVRAA